MPPFRLFGSDPAPEPPLDDQTGQQLEQLSALLMALTETVTTLQKNIERSAREQLRANALAESAIRAQGGTVERPLERPSQLRPPTASNGSTLKLIEALMPILDGIEAGLSSGKSQIEHLDDPAARGILQGWLDGQRLLRDRLLSLFDKEDVHSIATIGQPFDPYRHVAIETVDDATRPAGMIIAEQRGGYETSQRVVRFADVVVTRRPPNTEHQIVDQSAPPRAEGGA